MLDMIFTIGAAISAGLFIYGAYLAIHYALFHEHIATTSTADELPEIREKQCEASVEQGRPRAVIPRDGGYVNFMSSDDNHRAPVG
jgi:hypothetical protein